MNIKSALDVSQRSVSFKEAEILLSHALNKTKEWVIAHPEKKITKEQENIYLSFLNRREKNEPVAYIIGEKEFFSRTFLVDKRALIPRPETEALIEIALDWAKKESGELKILELGTGCGNIAITLNLELNNQKILHQIIATDIDKDAIELAQKNCHKLKTTNRLKILRADLFKHKLITKSAPYNLIIANLPYVPDSWKMDPSAQKDVVFYEPDIALFGGEDGLNIYRSFFQLAPKFLADKGIIIIEFSEQHANGISKLAQQAFPNSFIKIQPDYAGLDRVLIINLNPVN